MILVNKAAISKEAVEAWFTKWETLREQIHVAHDARDGSAKLLMEQGIALFNAFLVETAVSDEQGGDYELFPVNGKERFNFIKMKPGQYACYRQLDELFKETKKRCARLRLKANE